MGAPIPHSIKVKVAEEWIQGISRDKIAQNSDIGTVTVTSIIQQTKSNIADIDLMRALALKIKKENLDFNYFASAVRLKNLLDRLELSEEQSEAFLEEVNIHCFKKQISKKEFVSNIDKLSNLAHGLNISMNDIPDYINQMTKELDILNKELSIRQQQIKQKIGEYNLTIEDLEEYRSNKPLVDKIHSLKYALSRMKDDKSRIIQEMIEIENRNEELRSKKNIPEKEFVEANKKLPKDNPLTLKELIEITERIFSNPSPNVDIIKIVRERYLSKPIEKIKY